MSEQISTRRLQVVKYRGSTHGTNEYPFLINENGITVLPVTSLGLNHKISYQRISSGIARLDTMLEGKGYYRGSTVLVSGTAGSGKSSVAAHFVNECCQRGERALYFAFEEAPDQVIRNMHSIGLDLQRWVKKGLLQFHANRPTLFGLEMHLAVMVDSINKFNPSVVVVDPANSFTGNGEVKAMILRLIDFLKSKQVTVLFTSLTADGEFQEHTDISISSLIDTWLLLRASESNGERNRTMFILKSRGMAHSNQLREFLITNHGVDLLDVYLGPSGVLTGSARMAQTAQEQAAKVLREQEIAQRQYELERKRQVMDAQIAALRAEFEAEQAQALRVISQEQSRENILVQDRLDMAKSRKADQSSKKSNGVK